MIDKKGLIRFSIKQRMAVIVVHIPMPLSIRIMGDKQYEELTAVVVLAEQNGGGGVQVPADDIYLRKRRVIHP